MTSLDHPVGVCWDFRGLTVSRLRGAVVLEGGRGGVQGSAECVSARFGRSSERGRHEEREPDEMRQKVAVVDIIGCPAASLCRSVDLKDQLSSRGNEAPGTIGKGCSSMRVWCGRSGPTGTSSPGCSDPPNSHPQLARCRSRHLPSHLVRLGLERSTVSDLAVVSACSSRGVFVSEGWERPRGLAGWVESASSSRPVACANVPEGQTA